MLHTKRLAHRDTEIRKPERIKSLFFATVSAVALSSLLSCTHAAAAPKSETTVQNASFKKDLSGWLLPAKELKGKCGADLTKALEPDERVMESKCTDGYEYVLTDKSVLIFPRQEPDGGESISLSHIRANMRGAISIGIVDWEASDQAAYFLLRDGSLIMMPLEDERDYLPTYDMHFNASGMGTERMVYFSGYLLVASPAGDILSLKNEQWGAQDSGITDSDAGFSVSEGRLFFGKKSGQKVEIKIGKDGPVLSGP